MAGEVVRYVEPIAFLAYQVAQRLLAHHRVEHLAHGAVRVLHGSTFRSEQQRLLAAGALEVVQQLLFHPVLGVGADVVDGLDQQIDERAGDSAPTQVAEAASQAWRVASGYRRNSKGASMATHWRHVSSSAGLQSANSPSGRPIHASCRTWQAPRASWRRWPGPSRRAGGCKEHPAAHPVESRSRPRRPPRVRSAAAGRPGLRAWPVLAGHRRRQRACLHRPASPRGRRVRCGRGWAARCGVRGTRVSALAAIWPESDVRRRRGRAARGRGPPHWRHLPRGTRVGRVSRRAAVPPCGRWRRAATAR